MIVEYDFMEHEPIEISSLSKLPQYEIAHHLGRKKVSEILKNISGIKILKMNVSDSFGIYIPFEVAIDFETLNFFAIRPPLSHNDIDFRGYLSGYKTYRYDLLDNNTYIISDESIENVITYCKRKDRRKKISRILNDI
jgi:hypothetical protein